MKKTIIALTLALCLSACASSVKWVHPTKSSQEFSADNYDCEKVAEQVACNWRQCGNIFTISHEQIMCLRNKHGWYTVRQ